MRVTRASFGAGGHGRGGNGHRQTYQVRRAVGPAAVAGPGGEPLTNGATFEVTGSGQGVHALAGVARDVFADERPGFAVFAAIRRTLAFDQRLVFAGYHQAILIAAKASAIAVVAAAVADCTAAVQPSRSGRNPASASGASAR